MNMATLCGNFTLLNRAEVTNDTTGHKKQEYFSGEATELGSTSLATQTQSPPPPREDEMIFTNNTPKMGIKLVYSMLGSNSTIYIQTLTEIIFTHKLRPP